MKMKPRNASGKIHKKYLLEALVKVRGRCEKKLHVYLLQNPKELSWQYNAGWTVQFE